LGFINCEWVYEAIFLDKKQIKLTGNGITYDQKIYVLKELDFNKAIGKLDISVMKNPVKMKHINTLKEKNLKINSGNEHRLLSESDCPNLESSSVYSRAKFSVSNSSNGQSIREKVKEKEIISLERKINKLSNSNKENDKEIQLNKQSFLFGCFNIFN
jgi:hypothetical protein